MHQLSLRFGFVAALVIGLIGCDSADLNPTPTNTAAPTTAAARPAAPDDPRLNAAMRVQDQHTPVLMKEKGVIGTAARINAAGEGVVVIYTLSPEHARRAELPEQLDDVKVEVRVTGLITAYDTNNPQTKERPAPNGFSVGHPDITAGTIGARVTDGSNVYILSNNHVIANSNAANVGDPILQPGPYDGGTSADQIGTLSDYEPISFSGNNTMDAAIAVVNSADLTGATPSYAYGAPGTSVASPSVGLAVQKFGRTTGYTTGSIVATNVTISVCYEPSGFFGCNAAATFVDQFEVQSSSGDFSAGGDSGSLIVTNDGNKNPVGLLFAGGGASTFANPIDVVFQRFGVSIDTGSGDGGGGDTNDAPTASFTTDCTDLSCSFDASGSSDSDGSIASYAWTFGDGASGSGVSESHTYGSDGTYTVTLTVTDNDGATNSASQNVTVSSGDDGGSGGGIELSANGYKVRGRHNIDLTWSGATSTSVDVYRNGSVLTTTANDGAYTDATNNRGGATYSYQVCEAGTSTCSATVTVTF
jgi:PKD repeat protein